MRPSSERGAEVFPTVPHPVQRPQIGRDRGVHTKAGIDLTDRGAGRFDDQPVDVVVVVEAELENDPTGIGEQLGTETTVTPPDEEGRIQLLGLGIPQDPSLRPMPEPEHQRRQIEPGRRQLVHAVGAFDQPRSLQLTGCRRHHQ
jgi:hypothetical protein